ncbi:MAG: TraR/DksA family transcriptional regulator [Fibrobacteraceae bacterium]|jgi:RNA polymerase-binding protein DksA|nr:TraR/DksA family transcriptional regulator [Fibrobacteraceae bacterium]MEE1066997.1 TraR/DksA C4-type zinc finger protein [Fibrobacteraceae bacterium]
MAEKKTVKMSKKDLEYFESLLLEKRREIVASQVGSSSTGAFHTQKHQAEMVGYSNHLTADAASDYTSLETTFDLAAREGKFLVYLEEALQRIKKGTFGVCKVCNQLIPRARLEAVPTATKCVNCKEETKKKEREDHRVEMAKAFAEQHRMQQR